MAKSNLDDKARIFQRAKSELGLEGDIESFIQRVHDIDKGLVSEDELIYFFSWTGKCRLIHKLDQVIFPPTEIRGYVIPDLLVEFIENGNSRLYLIEIKTSKDTKLSWASSYYEGLIKYSRLVKIPVLIAWKITQLDIWTLFAIERFVKGPSNYKISMEKAYQENMMSRLAGDFVIVPYKDLGLCIQFKKQHKIAQVQNETTWHTLVDDVYFVGDGGKRVSKIDNNILLLLLSLTGDTEMIESETHVTNKYKPADNEAIFVQSIIIRLAKASSNDVRWIERTNEKKYPFMYDGFYKSLTVGIDLGLIRNILHTKPQSE